MKKHQSAAFILLLALAFAENAFAQIQSVKITPKNVTYNRKGEDVPDFKKTFEVNYPEISGVKNPAVLKTLKNTISYWKVFETTLEENTGDYHWLSSMDYKVNFNNEGFLAIDLIMEGVGAYPDQSVESLVINLNTGRRIAIKDGFTNLPKLVLMLDKVQKAEEKRAIANLQKESPEDVSSLREALAEYKNPISTLDNFTIGNDGVTFIYDYGFPHVIEALEPEGRYKFSWQQIKPYIKPGGALAKFAK